MTTQPDPVRFPFPPSPVHYDIGPEIGTLVAKCPVARAELPDGSPAWVVTGFDEVREVLVDQRYSRALAHAPGRAEGMPGVNMIIADTLLGKDPPEHTRLRKLAAAAFTDRRVRALRPEVARIVDDLLDQMLAGPRPADLVHAFSLPLPSAVICSLLGVPPQDLDRFNDWSNTLLGEGRRPMEEMARAYVAINAYMAELIARKREEPAGDLISALIDARESGDKLSEDELIKFCFGLLIAGHETTASQISLSFVTLCQHPDELNRLCSDPGLIPGAVEELLRFAPIFGFDTIPLPRVTREEVCLGGVTIPAGETVMALISVANRDERTFPDPDRLDLLRSQKSHVSFGFGTHHCLGSQLARVELQEALRGLVTRVPRLRMAVPLSAIEFQESQAITSVRELPVTWDGA